MANFYKKNPSTVKRLKIKIITHTYVTKNSSS